jgi:hypothetical protein
MMLQSLLNMLLVPANVELMVIPLSSWEKRVWREAQGGLPAEDRAWFMVEFMEDRLRYATNMVATSERHVLPKPIPLHRSQRSPSSEGQGGRYGHGNSSGRNAGHDRHREWERRQEKGALPTTEDLGSRG